MSMAGAVEFDIVDAHVHLYRSLSLEKQNVVDPGRRDRDRWGNPEAVTGFMDREGISSVLCLPNFPTRQMRATRTAQLSEAGSAEERQKALADIERDLAGRVQRQNEWLCELHATNPRLVPAVGIQKLFSPDQMVEEVRRRAAQGARTVKMLPGLYFEYPQDRAFWPMYAVCQDLGVTITSDTGTLGEPEAGVYYGEPAHFEDVLQAFPRLTLVMAHFPSAFWDERVELAMHYDNLAFDISGGFLRLAPHMEVRDEHRALAVEDAVRIMRKVGIERFMFGSDGPRFRFQPALEQVLALDLTDAEKKALLADNARRIYRI
jgi:predicted TIM-barrel fold metal-dependent hydrolase